MRPDFATKHQDWSGDESYRVVAEVDGSGVVTSRFVYGSQSHSPDYLVRAGVTYAYVKNHLGSVRLVVDAATGAIAQRIDYDPWGNVIADTNPDFQPFAFAGGVNDRDTRLTHFGYRDYDAAAGIWTAKDPLGLPGGLGLFAYTESNPVGWVDPSGLFNPTKGLSAVLNAANSARLFVSGSTKVVGAVATAPTVGGAVLLGGLATWNFFGAKAAMQRAVVQWDEAVTEDSSQATARNLLGVLPFGDKIDDPCEPSPVDFYIDKLKNFANKPGQFLSELGSILG